MQHGSGVNSGMTESSVLASLLQLRLSTDFNDRIGGNVEKTGSIHGVVRKYEEEMCAPFAHAGFGAEEKEKSTASKRVMVTSMVAVTATQ